LFFWQIPDDDKFINCARSGGIKYIVSGDKDLLILDSIGGIQIVEVAYFLNTIEMHD